MSNSALAYDMTAPRPPNSPSTGRPRSASAQRLASQRKQVRQTMLAACNALADQSLSCACAEGASADREEIKLMGNMTASDRTKVSTVVRMLQEYGFEKIDSLKEFRMLLDSFADKRQPPEFGSSCLSESDMSVTYTAEPSPVSGLVEPRPPARHTMDGCWKISSASIGKENVASWLQRLCIRNGRVLDATGTSKALRMVNGVAMLDGGQLHLDSDGNLRRYGKKGDTVVNFSRDRAPCPSHSPNTSPETNLTTIPEDEDEEEDERCTDKYASAQG